MGFENERKPPMSFRVFFVVPLSFVFGVTIRWVSKAHLFNIGHHHRDKWFLLSFQKAVTWNPFQEQLLSNLIIILIINVYDDGGD